MMDYKSVTINAIYSLTALIGVVAFFAWLPRRIRIIALLATPLLLIGCSYLCLVGFAQQMTRQAAEKDLDGARILLGIYLLDHKELPRTLEEIAENQEEAQRLVEVDYFPNAGQGEALLASKDEFPGLFGFGRHKLAITKAGLETGRVVRLPVGRSR